MLFKDGLFTSEAVSAGHPDKLCDLISDTVLDAFLARDPHSRVACEAFAADNKIIVAGEVRTARESDFEQVRAQVPDLIRSTLRRLGYGSSALDIDPASCEIEVRLNRQSPQIAAGVDQESGVLGAGDQGHVFGYATNETSALTPLAWTLATDLIAVGDAYRKRHPGLLRPDAKSQVTVRYERGVAVSIDTVVLSWQHEPAADVEHVRDILERYVINPVLGTTSLPGRPKLLINSAGPWTIGGPKGDTGLTGRKIIVDTYGGACPHGGGAFSGKDPSKVDRSGAYAARWVAKHVVAAGLAEHCTVQIAYAIGRAAPVSVSVDLHGTGVVSEQLLAKAIEQVFDLTPAGIIAALDLLRPIYVSTSSLGHFGKWRDENHRWESLARVRELQRAVAAAIHEIPVDLGSGLEV